MTCYLCAGPIGPHDELNWHHPEYKSMGGVATEPTHAECHVRFHIAQGDFKDWGRRGGQQAALTKRWSWNLLNVRSDPTYQAARDFYSHCYARAGWSAGL